MHAQACEEMSKSYPTANLTPHELQVSNSHATRKAMLKDYFPGEESVAKLKFALVGDQIASLQIRSRRALRVRRLATGPVLRRPGTSSNAR